MVLFALCVDIVSISFSCGIGRYVGLLVFCREELGSIGLIDIVQGCGIERSLSAIRILLLRGEE
jgi:hypothetical protein